MNETITRKKHILFVDDEERVLEGLERMLHPMRREWQMNFVGDANQALERLGTGRYDVIVTDVRMPGMDGTALLSRLQDQYPDVVRVVLSGHTELEATLRALPVAHQFLSKPCQPQQLRKVIDRACALNDLLASEQLRSIVGGIGALPSMPEVFQKLMDVLAKPDSSAAAVARVIETDMALTAKVLQLTNSAYLGLSRRISTLQHAVAYLGLNQVKNLVLSSEVYRWMDEERCPRGFSPERLQRHAFLCARMVGRILGDSALVEDAVTACIVIDIGQLVLAMCMKSQFEAMIEESRSSGRPLHEVEYEALGVSHAEIGAYLLGLWGFSYPVVEAVAHHHAPQRVDHPGLDVLGTVALADQLASECLDPDGDVSSPMGRDYLSVLGVLDQLDELRERTRCESLSMREN